jgi:Uri superfamily endonuclease
MHWHIDRLLRRGEVVSTMAIPCDEKERECGVADAVSRADGASVPVEGFGSSDCSCPSHLFYFGDVDTPWAMESLAHALTFLPCAYERARDRG